MNYDFIHIGDFKRFFKKRKRSYIAIGVFFAFSTFLVCLIVEPKYVLQASFKEASMRSENSSASMLRTLLKSPSGSSGGVDLGTQALSVMKSRLLVQKVVEDMGLQGDVKLASLKDRLVDRFLCNYKLAVGRTVENSLFCKVKQVSYFGKEIKKLYIQIISENEVEVYSPQWQLLCKQDYRKPFLLSDVGFVLEINSKGVVNQKFLLEIYPVQVAVDRVINILKLKTRREDPNFLDLAYKDKDPKRGAAFLNILMGEYKHYLVKENDRIARAQLEYLTNRQGEIANKLDESLKHHVEYLQTTLGDKGFMGLHQEIEMMESKKKRHQQRLLEIELDLNKVGRIKMQKLFSLQDSFLGQEVRPMQQTLLGLKKQKDGLDLAVMKRMSCFSEKTKQGSKRGRSILRLTTSKEVMKGLEDQLEVVDNPLPIFTNLKEQLKDLYLEKDRRDIINIQKIFMQEPVSFEYETISGLKQAMHENLLVAPQEKKNSLLHKIHLLNLREIILKERLEKESTVPRELEGIDLETAKTLHVQYVHELDESHLKKKHLQFVLDTIEADSFEISSITNLVGDAISQDIVKETMQLSSELKNEKYLSDKDRIRLKEQLARKKEIFKIHLKQMMQLSDLRLQLIEDKIVILQQVISDLVNQDIAIVEEQMATFLQEKIEALTIERDAIRNKLQDLQIEMKGIPRKWLIENRLQLQSDLNISMMEGMAQLVESKNVEHHLVQVESKAIDEAYIPLKPKQIPLFAYAILGGVLAVFVTMGIDVGKRIVKGFPVSLEGLKSRNLQVSRPFLQKPFFETLHTLKEEHLEILRQMVRFLLQEKILIAGVILNELPNYARILGTLIGLSGKKILLIESFSTDTGEKGLLDYLSGDTKEIVIQQQDDIHRVALGHRGLYGVEMLSTLKFKQLLQELQKNYEVILMVTDKKVNSSEAHKIFEFSQKMIITLDEESLDDLYPYIHSEERTLYLAFE